MRNTRWTRTLLVLGGWLLAITPSLAQTNYSWNYLGTDWSTAGNWSPSGVPSVATDDVVNFGLNNNAPTTFSGGPNPTLAGPTSVAVVNFGGFVPSGGSGLLTVTGNTTLTIGNGLAINTAPILSIQGGTRVDFDSAQIAVAAGTGFAGFSSGASAPLIIEAGGQLTVRGGPRLDTSAANLSLAVRGGVLALTNAGGVNLGSGQLRVGDGGTINTSGGFSNPNTANVTGQLAVGGGDANVVISVNSGPMGTFGATLNVTNGGANGPALTRLNDSGVVFFSSNGNYVGTPNRVVRLTGTGAAAAPTTTNGVIADALGSPYAVVTNQSGGARLGRFAGVTNAFGTTFEVGQATSTPVTNLTAATALSATTNGVFIFGTDQGANMPTNIAAYTLVLEPTVDDLGFDLDGGQLQSQGILLSGPRNLFVSTTEIGGSATTGTRQIIVSDPAGVLELGIGSLLGSGIRFNKSGPGTLQLFGLANQASTGQDLTITGGTLRATTSSQLGTNNTLRFRGGVLQLDSGGTFTRSLGNGVGQVNWSSSGNLNDGGSGGFAAANTNLTVNLGGQATPATLTWGSDPGFVPDGAALRFGAPQAAGSVTWLNPLKLDDGPGALKTRVIEVMQGGGGRAIFASPISGSVTTDLVKRGNGILELPANNTFTGNLIIAEGTLSLATTGTLASSTIVVGSGTTFQVQPSGFTLNGPKLLRGLGTITAPTTFTLAASISSTISADPSTSGGLSVDGNLAFVSTGALRARLASGTTYGRIIVNSTSGTPVLINPGPPAFASLQVVLEGGHQPLPSFLFGIVDVTGPGAISGTFLNLPQNGTFTTTDGLYTGQISYIGNIVGGVTLSPVGGNDIVLFNFQPVPEPGCVLALSIGGIWLARRRRGSTLPDATPGASC